MASDDNKDDDIEIVHPIVLVSGPTRFSKDNQPKNDRSAYQKKSREVRKALKKLAACDINLVWDEKKQDFVFENLTNKKLTEMMRGPMKRKLSAAEMLAAKMYMDAMKGNTKAQMYVTDCIDGKLINKTVESKVTLEELLSGSFENDAQEDDDDDA